MALAAAVIPILKDVSLHGKTRANARKRKIQGTESVFRRLLRQEWLQVNKRLFVLFYVVGILSLSTCCARVSIPLRTVPLHVLLLLHLGRRVIECLCVHVWHPSGTMHVLGLVLGLVYYIMLPFAFIRFPCRESSICNLIKHRLGGVLVDCGAAKTTVISSELPIRQYVVVLLVSLLNLLAQYQQHIHHKILAKLRKRGVDRTYSIPRGCCFHYLSSPHYWFEICIYFSFAILHESFLSGVGAGAGGRRHWLLFCFVASNLSVSAWISHQWYCSEFGEAYSRKRRKVIIPYVF